MSYKKIQVFNKNIFFVILLSSFFSLPAQNEFSKWYFGYYAGLDFATSPPTVLTNGIMNAGEGCATISDNLGNLLFYVDAITVYNSSHAVMANGTGLSGNQSSTQAAIIVKRPGNNNMYYVFSNAGAGAEYYSIVDMSLAAGLGSVTIKNVLLHPTTCEKQVAVRHCNGKDVWIITHDYNSNQFRTFLLNSTGVVLPPVISAIGETPVGGASGLGQVKISPDGKKLAMAVFTLSIPQSMGTGGFQLYDFDASSGIVSNSLTLINATNLTAGAYGVEFSSDGSKLYGTTSPGFSSYTCTLHQWNICAGSNSAVVASHYSVSLGSLSLVGSAQRAIDGKIYIAAANAQSLSVINNPNASGAAMNFVLNGQNIAPEIGKLGLPNYINNYTRPSLVPFTNTAACQTASFSVPPVPSFSSGCTSTPYAPISYLWDFGEPAAGANNTSTLTNPTHTYSSTGNYSVSLILYNPCTNDTLRKVITVSALAPTVNVTGNFNICKGEKNTYTVSGGSTYLWSNNTTAPTTTFAPGTTTVYSASATLNGCTATKQFTVTVNPCTGIVSNDKEEGLRIFPNPVKDLLSIESVSAGTVMIYDLDGRLLLESKINAGHNEINTGSLKPGVYSIVSGAGKGAWRGRMVKME